MLLSKIQEIYENFVDDIRYRAISDYRTSTKVTFIACLLILIFVISRGCSSASPKPVAEAHLVATPTPNRIIIATPSITPFQPVTNTPDPQATKTSAPTVISIVPTVVPPPEGVKGVGSFISVVILDFLAGGIDNWIKLIGLIGTIFTTFLIKRESIGMSFLVLLIWLVVGIITGFLIWIITTWERLPSETYQWYEVIGLSILHALILGALQVFIMFVLGVGGSFSLAAFFSGLTYGALNWLLPGGGANINLLISMLIWGCVGLLAGYLVDHLYRWRY